MTRPLQICHVITTINRGGAENHLFELVRGQVEDGMRVAVAYLKGDGYWRAPLEALGVEVIALGLRRYGDVAPLLTLRRAIRRLHPDLVHAHLGPAEVYARGAIAGRSGLPFVVSRHNEATFTGGAMDTLLARWVGLRAARVIAISASVQQFYCGCHRFLPLQRVPVVHYGIDPAPYLQVAPVAVAARRQEWGIKPETLAVGTVARMVPAKALHVLLEAFALLVIEAPATKLVLVGTGPLEADLRRRAVALDIQEKVVWAGFQEDIPCVMAAFDIFALTSVTEGFGLVLLEAMSAARPVVASAVSAIPEIVVEGETGCLVPPGDPAALAHALAVLACDPESRLKLGEAGRRRALESFTLKAMQQNTIAVYRSILANRPVTGRPEAAVPLEEP
ncbi:glycosyltransferase [Geomonas subterranea]|uniref:Glycosyltransferase n=1 Tax=Geomonas subterranea TaxID=2847989 RepID=A0ABX8LMK7_9BACT|nr:glycosyltransferase [Geomonas subterranea]QXE91554.1 glycosyltransferase [Geomonas subterranea]QXM10357.1 glycosyltransferase [Geomonas subterranea]